MTNQLYHYKAHVLEVQDGDALFLEIDLGFRIRLKQMIQFYGITILSGADEGHDHSKAAEYLKRCVLDSEVLLETVFDRKGANSRYLGVIHFLEDGNWVNLNEKLVSEGLAVEVEF